MPFRSSYILQDWEANRSNSKFRAILLLFRASQLARRSRFKFLFYPYLIFYRVFVEWILGVELPWNLVVGKGLIIYHGVGLVVNDAARIGSNCVLRNGVTIGNKIDRKGRLLGAPVLGSNVDVGSNACIIGPISIGDNVTIGAGSVVVKDLPSDCIAAGNPARVLIRK